MLQTFISGRIAALIEHRRRAARASGFVLASAADVEAFEAQETNTGRPNVLFVLDSTESLGSTIKIPDYDPAFVYPVDPATCNAGSLYFRTTSPDPFTSCKSTGANRVGQVPKANLKCDGLDQAELEGSVGPMRFVEKLTVKQGNNFVTVYQPLQPTVKQDSTVFCETYSGADKRTSPTLRCSTAPMRWSCTTATT